MPKGNDFWGWFNSPARVGPLLILIVVVQVATCVAVGRVADGLAVQANLLRAMVNSNTDDPSASWTDASYITHVVRTPPLSADESDEAQAHRHKAKIDIYNDLFPARK
jgi:hypothetical protein